MLERSHEAQTHKSLCFSFARTGGINLTGGKVLDFSGSKQWYKVHDGANGDVISGISKMQ